uniref:Histone-lysine N-methyltransferase, H3 lysine-79 specific n=1 Tax=Steinernema glaseri TaxID=37863 RepID=A0A1I7YPY2_9BILA
MKGDDKADPASLIMKSPINPRESLQFTLTGEADEAVIPEALEIMRIAFEFYPELQAVVDREYPDLSQIISVPFLRDAVATFNKASKTLCKLWKGTTTLLHRADQPIDGVLFKRIWTLAYNRAIKDPKALNRHYGAFSNETYGETTYDRMQAIIEEINPTKKDVFVDMGSGIGQLVIHMAGVSSTQKSVGIEVADLPSSYSKHLESEFLKFMKFFGKNPRRFQLEQGDFLDMKFRRLITEEATIILINNMMFSPELDTRIKRELLSELKDGTRIITTRAYGRVDRSSVTERRLNDVSSILDVQVLQPCANAGSWTSKYVPYYLHTVNRAKLEVYYQKRQNMVSDEDETSFEELKPPPRGARKSMTPLMVRKSKTPTMVRKSKTPSLARKAKTPSLYEPAFKEYKLPPRGARKSKTPTMVRKSKTPTAVRKSKTPSLHVRSDERPRSMPVNVDFARIRKSAPPLPPTFYPKSVTTPMFHPKTGASLAPSLVKRARKSMTPASHMSIISTITESFCTDNSGTSSEDSPPELAPMSLDLGPTEDYPMDSPSLPEYPRLKLPPPEYDIDPHEVVRGIGGELDKMSHLQKGTMSLHAEVAELSVENYFLELCKQRSVQPPEGEAEASFA